MRIRASGLWLAMLPYRIDDESISQSRHSPGIVQPAEILLRLGFNPEHMRDGKIGPVAITVEDITVRGMSVDREKYVKHQILSEKAKDMMNRGEGSRKQALISSLSCKDIRDLTDENSKRAFIVIDTAEPENNAHASVYSAYVRGRGQVRKIRKLLLELMQNYQPLDAYLLGNHVS